MSESPVVHIKLGELVCGEEYEGRDTESSDVEQVTCLICLRTALQMDRFMCAICGKPAACLGRYEGNVEFNPACDECCGHGNEDGECFQLVSETGEYMSLTEMLGRLNESERALKAATDEADKALEFERQKSARLKTLAKEATNGWACYARTKLEHNDISRLHQALDAFEAQR